MRTLIVKTKNFLKMLNNELRKNCYEILDYESKFLLVKLPLFHEFNFVKGHIYVNKTSSLILDIFY